MRLSALSKAKRLAAATTTIALTCLLLVGSLFLRGAPAQASSLAQSQGTTVYHSVTKGTIAPAGIADPRHPPQAAKSNAASATKHLVKGARSILRGNRANAAPGRVSASSNPLHHTGSLLQNFNGVSSLDSEITNFGSEFEPPDQGLCEGNGFVVEPVNSAFTIYRTNGSVVLGPLNVNVLFDEGLTEFTSDPRCYFDKTTNTWVAIILFISADNTEARTDIAVNHSGDPTMPWTVYHLEATDDGSGGMPNHPGCPCLGDQPLIGLDSENLYISTNEFSILGPQFNGAQIYALSKKQLFTLRQSVNFVHFDKLRIGGTDAASVQPAITNGFAAAEYFLNSLDPFGTFDNRLGAWALTNRQSVSEGGVPTLSSIVIQSETYGLPVPAVQKGNTATLDAGDDRMQQVQFINGSLWGALDTNVTIPNDTEPRDGLAWFQVVPFLNVDLIGAATIVNQGYVASLGNYLLYPAIQASPRGSAAIVFTFTGQNNFPSAAYAVMKPWQRAFGPVTIAADGTGPYNQGTRWGDYSWAIVSPDGNSFWLATEYIPPASSQTTDGITNWGTRVFQVAA